MQERVELSQAGPLAHTQAINACFAHDSVEEIYHALEQRGDKWSTDTLKLLKGCVILCSASYTLARLLFP